MSSPFDNSLTAEHEAPARLSSVMCLWAAITAGLSSYAFEALRYVLLPHISETAGHLATVLFAATASAIGCRVVVGIGRRMHQQLRNEVLARKETEQFFRVIAVATNAGIWNWDVVNDVTWFNPEFVEGNGFQLEEATSFDFWSSHVHPEDRERVCGSLSTALVGNDTSWSQEYRFRRADGSYAYVLDRGVIFRGAGGRPLRVSGGMVDLTQRKQAQAEQLRTIRALQASEAAFRSLFENAPFGMYRSTGDGTLFAANRALVAMLGYNSVDELAQINVARDIYSNPDDRASIVKRLLEEESITGVELQWKTKSGKTIMVRFSARLCKEAGEPFFECTAEDITQHRELQQELQQAQKMDAIGQLAGGVAHDFNNMLQVIRISTELLQADTGANERRRKRLDEIIKTCDRASTLTQQLLAFGRRQMRAPQLLNLNAVVADAMSMIHRLIGDAIELTFQAARVPCTAIADPSQIVQVLMNLCINARDAMPNGGALDVVTDVVTFTAAEAPAGIKPGSHSVLCVRDTGSGMSEEVLAHLFEPFYTTKQKGKHSGLGLATVYGIIRQSDGAVLVESEPGRGSAFRVFLPHAVGEKAQAVTSAGCAETGQGSGETILMVEDEPSLRTAIGEFFTRCGYDVITAENGEDALKVVAGRLEQIDVLLTDVAMPKMGGRELAQRLTTLAPGLKVIFMSGYSDDDVLRESILAGAAFVQKPFQFRTLLGKMREMLASPPSISAAAVIAQSEPGEQPQSLR